jgi:uncharacterized protein YndB with AHSA1/START domain
MPRVTRRRTIEAPVGDVWRLVSDPHNLPRWWPRTARVENVDNKDGGRRSQWTKVLQTAEGRGVRADFRCISAANEERYVWEQELEGTPFAKHLKRSEVEVALRGDGEATAVAISSVQTMRGLSRLGAVMLKRAQGAILDEALDGLEETLAS